MVWADTDTFRIGEWHLGIRTNNDAAAETVRRLLAPHHAPGIDAPSNFSIALAGATTARGAKNLNQLFVSGSLTVRTRNPARALAGLLYALHPFAADEADELFRLRAASVVTMDGDAYLVPGHVTAWLKQLQPRLSRIGVRLADTQYVTIDPATSELVVPAPALDYDETFLAEHETASRSGSELPRVVPGRYPVRAWAWPSGPEMLGPTSKALAVAAQLAFTDMHEHGVQRTLEMLRDIFERVVPYGVWYSKPEDFVTQLGAAMAAA